MTDQELREKIKATQSGDLEARNAVIVATQGMVRTIVTRFARQAGREDLIEDMCQEAIFGTRGTGGIVRAAERYRVDGAETFSSFATQYVLSVCREIALPSMITKDQVRKRNKVKRQLQAGTLEGHDQLRLAVLEGTVTESSVTEMRERGHHREDEDPRFMNEDQDTILPVTGANHIEEEMAEMLHGNEQKARFMAALDHLTLTERFVVTAIAGLNGAPVPAAKLAKRMGTSRFVVGRTLKRALQKIKDDPICRLS